MLELDGMRVIPQACRDHLQLTEQQLDFNDNRPVVTAEKDGLGGSHCGLRGDFFYVLKCFLRSMALHGQYSARWQVENRPGTLSLFPDVVSR